jgi:hypothetical protein
MLNEFDLGEGSTTNYCERDVVYTGSMEDLTS